MRSLLIGLLLTTLVAMGCSRHEEPAPQPPPPEKTQTHAAPVTPPTPASAPATATRTPVVHPPTPEVTFNNLEQYVAMDEQQRLAAVSTVGDKGADKAAAAATAKKLADMLRVESSPQVKTAILDELGNLEQPAALTPVLSTFDTSQPDEVKQSAIDAAESLLSDIASSGNPNALNSITSALDTRYPTEVRQAAISALEDLEDQRALPYLQKLLTDSDPDVRQQASDAIDWLKE